MFTCDYCKKDFPGFPKKCPHCRSIIDFGNVTRSDSSELLPLSSVIACYDATVIFDTETSGLNFVTDRIIELSYILIDRNGCVIRDDDLLIRLPDGEKLPSEIVALTGITDEMLNNGVEEKEAAERFADIFKGDRFLLVAHNAQFDINYLYRMLMRNGRAEILKNCDMLDTLTIYKDRRDYPHKLANAILAYNLQGKVKNSHRAIDDTLALYEVMKAMDLERNDLGSYINIFGYNPKYGVSGLKVRSVRYVPQPYNSKLKLYYKL